MVLAPDRSAMCNGYPGFSPMGPAIKLEVSAGDAVYMEVYAKYDQVSGGSSGISSAVLIAAVTGSFGIVNGGETTALWQEMNTAAPAASATVSSSTTVPRGYLAYLFFDDNDVFERAGAKPISEAAYNSFEKLDRSFTADKDGYLYIYVVNESDVSSAVSVYFDELYIVHQKNNTGLQVTQASDYYPFGLTFNEYQADRLEAVAAGPNPNYRPTLRNRYLFQGQELQKNLDLGWYEFKWRNHMPEVGRFFNVDPLADRYVYNSTYAFSENKLVSHVELEGLESQGVYTSIYLARERIRKEEGEKAAEEFDRGVRAFPKLMASFSDINDATILVTLLTRWGDAVDVNGEPADAWDIGFAGGGAFLPIIGGSTLQKVFGSIGEYVIERGRKLTDNSKGAIFERDILMSLGDDLVATNIDVLREGVKITEIDGVLKDGSLVQIFTGGAHSDQLKNTVEFALKMKAPSIKVFYSADVSQKTIEAYKRTIKEAYPKINIDYYIEWFQRSER